MFLRELAALSEDSEKFEPKLKVLMEDITHHVQEEEGEMFPKVEKVFDSATLEDLGKQMEEEKKNFQKSNAAKAWELGMKDEGWRMNKKLFILFLGFWFLISEAIWKLAEYSNAVGTTALLFFEFPNSFSG